MSPAQENASTAAWQDAVEGPLKGAEREAAAEAAVHTWLASLSSGPGVLRGSEVAAAIGEARISVFIEAVINAVLERPPVIKQEQPAEGGGHEVVHIRAWQVVSRRRTLDASHRLTETRWYVERLMRI